MSTFGGTDGTHSVACVGQACGSSQLVHLVPVAIRTRATRERITGVRGGCRGGILETVFELTVLHLGRSAFRQCPETEKWTISFDSPHSELGPSHSSILVREALSNVENVPTFHTRPFATMSCGCIEVESRAKDAHDAIGEERAWKAFGPRGTGVSLTGGVG